MLGRSRETGFLPTGGDFRGEQAFRGSQVGRGHSHKVTVPSRCGQA